MELVLDMCTETQRSIYDVYNVADALACVYLDMYQQGVAGQYSHEARHLWGQYGDIEGCR